MRVEGAKEWPGRRGEVRQAIISLQRPAVLLLVFLRPRLFTSLRAAHDTRKSLLHELRKADEVEFVC